MIDECSSENSCKDAAVDRFKDAFALYEKERYLTVLYMSGYVIELGIKSEFHKLKNCQLSKINHKANDILQHLFRSYFSQNDQPQWMTNFTFPSTLFDFLSFISNIANIAGTSEKGKSQLKRYINESNVFSVILSNRQLPSREAHSTFHNISGFLSELNSWRKLLGDSTFSPDDYEIEKLGWGVNLRYAGSVNTMNDEDAKKALLMTIKFLKEVLSVDMSEYENKINPNYNQKDFDMEKEY